MQPKVFIGNWKMYKTVDQTVEFLHKLAPCVIASKNFVGLAVPFTSIAPAIEATENTNIRIGAQNMNDATEGAFTGEISAIMLKDVGAQFVLLGHSERRHIFGELNSFINKKLKRALQTQIKPILCVGETLEQREAGETESILKSQLTQSLADISSEELQEIWIAYEPVWAIGTGVTATPEQAQAAHAFVRQVIVELAGDEGAKKIMILYGGSVKPENANELLNQSDIDGVLVGGASLNPETFSQIINCREETTLIT